MSSSIQNLPFYEYNGYRSLGRVSVGLEDEDWEGGEIVCDVVCFFFNTFDESAIDRQTRRW